MNRKATVPSADARHTTDIEQEAALEALEAEERRRAWQARVDELLRILRRAPQTWAELAAAGFQRVDVLLGVGSIVDRGNDRIRVGPLLVELEPLGGEEA